jgi:bile acid:Na+ symporter, BASS family
MNGFLQIALKITLVTFMASNLFGMGLGLAVRDTLAGLKDVRFVVLIVVCGWVLGPAFAYLLSEVVPITRPYAIGLLLVGMTPCAPFLPMVARRARADLGSAAALMMLSAIVTVVFMPIAVPLMIKGLTVDTWAIAKPLLFFILLPLAIGLAIKGAADPVATRLYPFVRKSGDISMVILMTLMFILYGKGFLSAVGSYAIGTQILFVGGMALAAHLLGFVLKREQRSVLTLGMCSRNAGAALAPLLAAPDADPTASVMVAMSIPITMAICFSLARLLGAHKAAQPEPEAAAP